MPKMYFSLYLEPDQFEYITRLAKQTKRAKASIVREMIDSYREQADLRKEGAKDPCDSGMSTRGSSRDQRSW